VLHTKDHMLTRNVCHPSFTTWTLYFIQIYRKICSAIKNFLLIWTSYYHSHLSRLFNLSTNFLTLGVVHVLQDATLAYLSWNLNISFNLFFSSNKIISILLYFPLQPLNDLHNFFYYIFNLNLTIKQMSKLCFCIDVIQPT
jgi:hypothetical protein